jgi:hypothetical protein
MEGVYEMMVQKMRLQDTGQDTGRLKSGQQKSKQQKIKADS